MANPVANWTKRHRNRTNFYLHMLGIPACFIVAPILLAMKCWVLAGGFFVGGYAVQFLGHLVEGNRSGEQALIERLLHLRR